MSIAKIVMGWLGYKDTFCPFPSVHLKANQITAQVLRAGKEHLAWKPGDSAPHITMERRITTGWCYATSWVPCYGQKRR